MSLLYSIYRCSILFIMVNAFLPFSDFQLSAEILDYRRPGKQRVEAMQIINVLQNPEAKGWKNHSAVKMRKGYEDALKLYFNIMVKEWIKQGYKNDLKLYEISDVIELPWWLGNKDFHNSHKASLFRKNKEYYENKLEVDDTYLDKGYVWPKIIDGKKVIEFSKL